MNISDETLQELTESYYLRGQRSALVNQLHSILGQLSIKYDGVDSAPSNLMLIAHLTKEREDAIASLRSICERYGDNRWDDNLYLSDIIEKNLGAYLL
jgi:hypothetical protein